MGSAAAHDDETAPTGRPRHVARKRALDVLYEADVRERPLPEVLAAHLRDDEELPDFSVALIRGVHRHREQIDTVIEEHSRGWKLSRMPIIDRNLLRVALFELLHTPDVPTPVVIDEAVELAKDLSTADSARFVNGLLARAAETANRA